WTQPGARGPQTYWVGEAARRLPGAQRPWHSDATQRAGYTLLVDAACAALAPPGVGTLDVDLVVGLPLALFASQKAAIQELLHGHVATVRRGAAEPVTLAVTAVTVFPQAAGAYYAGRIRFTRVVET
ncbi:MAG: hypothetical protein K6U07_07410, partial [Firmicutes bacterium]|nr:hypothetical protein [Bacillota bacterium]